MRHLCVYCGSGPGRNPAYPRLPPANSASACRRWHRARLWRRQPRTNGRSGARTLAAGGHVTGIIPEFLVTRERMLAEVNELIVTANMHERKMTMFERSDGFVAMPGGIGTLEELVEITTWAQLDRHNKPIILCNIDGYWDPLVTLFNHMRPEKFIREGLEFKLDVVTMPRQGVIPPSKTGSSSRRQRSRRRRPQDM